MLFVFHPDEEAARPVAGSALPLGAVLLCVCWPRPIQVLSLALQAWGTSPWVPIVLATEEVPEDALLLPFRKRGMGLTALQWRAGDPLPDGAVVRAQLARRAEVSAAEYVDYVGLRAGDKVGRLVESALAPATQGSMIRLRSPDRGAFTARSWRGLFGLVRALQVAWRGPSLSQEAVALELGVAPRTLSLWTGRFLQLPWRRALALACWEATLESALRCAGYVTDHIPARRASGSLSSS